MLRSQFWGRRPLREPPGNPVPLASWAALEQVPGQGRRGCLVWGADQPGLWVGFPKQPPCLPLRLPSSEPPACGSSPNRALRWGGPAKPAGGLLPPHMCPRLAASAPRGRRRPGFRRGPCLGPLTCSTGVLTCQPYSQAGAGRADTASGAPSAQPPISHADPPLLSPAGQGRPPLSVTTSGHFLGPLILGWGQRGAQGRRPEKSPSSARSPPSSQHQPQPVT